MRLLATSLAVSLVAFLVDGAALAEQGDAEDRALMQAYIDRQARTPADERGASRSNGRGTSAEAHPSPASGPSTPR